MLFTLDPPLSRPGRGRYWFAIKDANCFGAIPILADSTNPYLSGDAWRTTPGGLCEGPGGGVQQHDGPGVDLIFRLEFCDVKTPARTMSWGRLKALYK